MKLQIKEEDSIKDTDMLFTSAAEIKPFWSLSNTLKASLSSSSESVSFTQKVKIQ